MLKRLPVPEPYPPAAEFLTRMGRSTPVGAVADTVAVAVIVVGTVTVTLVKGTPLGPKSLAPTANPVPGTGTDVTCPSVTLAGEMAVTVGEATTAKQEAQEPVPPPRLLTDTV